MTADHPPEGPADPPRPPAPARSVVVVFDGQATPATMAGFCARAREALAVDGVEEVVCDVSAVADADLGMVDSLARLQLLAIRRGRRVSLRRASDDLRALLDLLGLRDVVPSCAPGGPGASVLEVVGQAEEGEQPGVEEVGDPGDPVA
ncbi:MAG TPA: STAS domain-containing protein [Acidimicrobiales bacterium]|nr:STAS domain-containing protein [Acidimicrobiales bacterium]